MSTGQEGTLMTVAEVKNRLRCSLSNVYNLIEAGELRCYRVGKGKGGIRVSERQLQDFLDSRETRPDEEEDATPLRHLR